ncbi:MAG: hypothetical protein WCF91_01185 [bacterium]
MQPNNQQPPTVIPPSGQSSGHEYDFITSTASAPQTTSPLGGDNKFKRVLVVLALLVIVLVVLLVGKSLLAGKSNAPQLLAVAQSQQQVIQLSTNALEVPGLSVENRNFAITSKLSVGSDQKIILKNLADKKIKTSDAILNKKIDSVATKKLSDSIANNTYNETFKNTMKEKLQDYQDSLIPAYKSSATQKGKDLFNTMSESNDLLIKMLGS